VRDDACFHRSGIVRTIGYVDKDYHSAAGDEISSMNDRDGQHDFDFEFGHWKIHNRRLLHPLSGSNDWVEFDGTVVAQPIWDGRANMDVFEADSPTGHLEGMTVRTYSTTSHQWSLYWATSRTGVCFRFR
jgi:hypothetical protein